MVTLSVQRASSAPQVPPIVRELEAVFEALDDDKLLTAIRGPVRRGPKGHSVETLWHCFVAMYVMGVDSTAALLRGLRNNPYLAEVCGIGTKGIPSEPTMARFFKRLASKRILPRLKDVSRSLVRKHHDTLPGFGRVVALDSTTIRAWSNGGKPKKSDCDAGWSVKKNSHAQTEFTYGYKLHLLVDCETQIPLAANVSAGNIHDINRATNLLGEARFALGSFRPSYVLGDAGYSSDKLRRTVNRQYGRALFDAPPNHKKAHMRMKNDAVHLIMKRQRGAVERAFSQLKRMHALNKVTVRGRMKVTAHAYIALVAMQAVFSGHLEQTVNTPL